AAAPRGAADGFHHHALRRRGGRELRRLAGRTIRRPLERAGGRRRPRVRGDAARSLLDALAADQDLRQPAAGHAQPARARAPRGDAGSELPLARVKSRITLITLGVDDLGRALRFYRDGLDLKTEGIIGTQF